MTATGSGLDDATAAEYRLRGMTLERVRTTPMDGLPRAVSIREVGPRDGFQNEPEVIPTERKVELIDALARTGVAASGGDELRARGRDPPARGRRRGARARIDVPERGERVGADPQRARAGRGARAARGARRRRGGRPAFDEINVFMSASETHNRKNVNRSIAESLSRPGGRARAGARGGLRCEGVISTSFGCPYEGHVPPERVLEIAGAPARRGRAGDRLRRHDRHGQPAPGAGVLHARRASRWGTGWS